MVLATGLPCTAIKPVGDATKLTITFGLKPRWYLAAPLAIFWPVMMRKRAQRVLDVTVDTAKTLLESEAQTGMTPG